MTSRIAPTELSLRTPRGGRGPCTPTITCVSPAKRQWAREGTLPMLRKAAFFCDTDQQQAARTHRKIAALKSQP